MQNLQNNQELFTPVPTKLGTSKTSITSAPVNSFVTSSKKNLVGPSAETRYEAARVNAP